MGETGGVSLKDLAALTPPVVVCIAFVVGLARLLRREMAPKRRVREDSGREAGNSGKNGIIDVTGTATARADTDTAGNAARNSDDHDDARRSPGGRGSGH
jgi:hypothetical protein